MHLPTILTSLLASGPALALPLINDLPPQEIASPNIPISALLLAPPPATAIEANLLKPTPTIPQSTSPRVQGALCHMPPLARDVALPSTTTWNFGYAHKNTPVEVPAGLQTQGPCEPRRRIDRWYDSSWIVPKGHPRHEEGDWDESVREEGTGGDGEAGVEWWRVLNEASLESTPGRE